MHQGVLPGVCVPKGAMNYNRDMQGLNNLFGNHPRGVDQNIIYPSTTHHGKHSLVEIHNGHVGSAKVVDNHVVVHADNDVVPQGAGFLNCRYVADVKHVPRSIDVDDLLSWQRVPLSNGK
eukprot:Lithocolla_globosa_v1_NODE_4360_length_1454_cov_22.780558.p2 type:complete len:120 gc:universal NODE_4360_length_1454_cov_22.780558:295-654(+)